MPVNMPQTAEGWVLKLGRDRPDLSSSELHLLLVLAARHNRDHQVAHPKLELLSRETHLSKRQILRLVNALADADRPGGQVLHISFGPLPVESRTGNPVYGNAYRFVGFDEVPDWARPRRRDAVDNQPTRGVNLSPTSRDNMSPQPGDTGDTVEVTSAGGSGDTGDAIEVTSANSPLYPVVNPGLTSFGASNPDLNPVRAEARATGNGTRNAICSKCGDELLIDRGVVRVGKTLLCVPCGRSAPPRASPTDAIARLLGDSANPEPRVQERAST